jgi:hypothetical protein
VNTGRVSLSAGVSTEKSFSLTQSSAQRASIAPGSYAFGNSVFVKFSGMKNIQHSVINVRQRTGAADHQPYSGQMLNIDC